MGRREKKERESQAHGQGSTEDAKAEAGMQHFLIVLRRLNASEAGGTGGWYANSDDEIGGGILDLPHYKQVGMLLRVDFCAEPKDDRQITMAPSSERILA